MTTPDEMGLTPKAAMGYEQYFVPAIFHRWPAKIIEAIKINDDDTVLEVGCGTGVLTQEICKHVRSPGNVTALDLSESMLSVARKKCPGVKFQQGNAMALPYDDASFDVVASQFMLMFTPDPVKTVSEMRRVLKPGGRLIIAVWEALDNNPVYAELARIARKRINDSAGDSLSWPFALGKDGALAEICMKAGAGNVSITAHEGRAIFPSLDEFVRTEIRAWVLADAVDDTMLDTVVADAQASFQEYLSASGEADFPLNALFATL
jgi:SAM-dependent methyltransferase